MAERETERTPAPDGEAPDEAERGPRAAARPERPPRGLLLAALLLGLMLVLFFGSPGEGGRFGQPPLERNEFRRLLAKNEVAEVRFKDTQARVTLRPGSLADEREGLVTTVIFTSPEDVTSEREHIQELAREQGVETEVHVDPTNQLLYHMLIWFVPSLLLIGFLYFFLFRQMRGPGGPGGLLNFGKSKAKAAVDKTDVTLKDVAGIDEARQDISEVIEFLKSPKKFSRLGGRIPKGVLLIGPPGCGKTLLAKATAGEAGVPFYSVSGSDFVEMFVGVGASRVRDLFEKAKETSPCIIFLDEVDAVGRRRGSGMGGGHDEREQTLNQILVEMDGFETDRGIIVMAATNRPDILDPALLRPGRFDRQIVIDMPNVEARQQILDVHARNKKLAEEVDLATLARATPTFSGAELEALLNEAALAAAMADRESIAMEDLEEARDRIRWGRQKKSWKILKDEVRATAYHEGGHALVAALIAGCDPLHKVTVVPRGRALGLTMSLPERDTYSMSKRQIEARIAMAFGGRIGEGLYTNDLSTGASNDIEQASALARRMITEWGMSAALGPIKYAHDDQDTVFLGREMGRGREHSEATMVAIDAEVRRVVDEQYQRAEELILSHREALDRIAEALVEYETLSGEEIAELVAGRALVRKPTPNGTATANGAEPSPPAAADAAPGEPGAADARGDGASNDDGATSLDGAVTSGAALAGSGEAPVPDAASDSAPGRADEGEGEGEGEANEGKRQLAADEASTEAAGEASTEASGEAAGEASGEAAGEATGEAAGEATGEAADSPTSRRS